MLPENLEKENLADGGEIFFLCKQGFPAILTFNPPTL